MAWAVMDPWRKTVLAVGTVFVVLEALDSFRIEFPVGGLVFAALVLAALAWTWRGGVGGPVAVGLLALLELAAVLVVYDRPETTFERLDYAAFAALSAALAVAAAGTVVRHRRGAKTAALPSPGP